MADRFKMNHSSNRNENKIRSNAEWTIRVVFSSHTCSPIGCQKVYAYAYMRKEISHQHSIRFYDQPEGTVRRHLHRYRCHRRRRRKSTHNRRTSYTRIPGPNNLFQVLLSSIRCFQLFFLCMRAWTTSMCGESQAVAVIRTTWTRVRGTGYTCMRYPKIMIITIIIIERW